MFLFYTIMMAVHYLVNSGKFDVIKSDKLSLDNVIVEGFEDNFKDDPLLDDFKTHVDRVLRLSVENNSSTVFYVDFEQQSIFDTVITTTGVDNINF